MRAKKPPDKSEIVRLYTCEKRPMHEVADMLSISVGYVHKLIHKYGIEPREEHMGFYGKKHKAESRKKLSSKLKGRKISEEARCKMSEAKKLKGIGHKKIRQDGYVAVYFPDHPKSTKAGYIMEHDLIMECLIGRHLADDEVVHHKNGIRNDNRKENLQLMTKHDHRSYHMKLRYSKKEGSVDLSTK